MQDSIQNNGGGHGAWQTVDEIVVPSHAAEPLVPVGMKTVGAVKAGKCVEAGAFGVGFDRPGTAGFRHTCRQ